MLTYISEASACSLKSSGYELIDLRTMKKSETTK